MGALPCRAAAARLLHPVSVCAHELRSRHGWLLRVLRRHCISSASRKGETYQVVVLQVDRGGIPYRELHREVVAQLARGLLEECHDRWGYIPSRVCGMTSDARSPLTHRVRVVKPSERVGRTMAVDAAVMRENRHHLRKDRERVLDGALPLERPRARDSAEEQGGVQSIVHGGEIEFSREPSRR